jgi:hypothetical protein
MGRKYEIEQAGTSLRWCEWRRLRRHSDKQQAMRSSLSVSVPVSIASCVSVALTSLPSSLVLPLKNFDLRLSLSFFLPLGFYFSSQPPPIPPPLPSSSFLASASLSRALPTLIFSQGNALTLLFLYVFPSCCISYNLAVSLQRYKSSHVLCSEILFALIFSSSFV